MVSSRRRSTPVMPPHCRRPCDRRSPLWSLSSRGAVVGQSASVRQAQRRALGRPPGAAAAGLRRARAGGRLHGARGVRRPAGRAGHRDRPRGGRRSVGGRLPHRHRGARRSRTRAGSLQPYAERVRRDTGRRLRGRDGAGPHPLHPPEPGQHRQEVRRRPRRRPGRRGVHRAGHRHPRPLDARGGPGVRRATAGRWSPWCRSGITIADDRQAAARRPRADPARGRCWCSAVGLAGTWLGEPPAAPADARAAARREITRMYEYYTAVLARGPRGPAAARQPTAGSSSSTTRRAGCWTCPTTWSAAPVAEPRPRTRAWCAAALGRTAEADDIYLAGDRVLVVSSAPARPGRARDVGAVVTLRDHTELRRGHRRAATWSAASASRCAPRTTSPPTGCTRWSRSSSWAGSSEAVDFATEELAGRAAAHRPGRRRGRRPGASRRCCSARTPTPPSAASSSRIEGELAAQRRARPRPGHRPRQPRRQRLRRGGRRPTYAAVRGHARRRRRAPSSSPSRTAARASTTTRRRTPSSAAGPPRAPADGRAAASAWPWSPRSRVGTAATSRSAGPPLGGAEFTVTLHPAAGAAMSASATSRARGRGRGRSPPRRTRRTSAGSPGFEVAGVARSAQRGGPVPRGATRASTWSCSTCTCPDGHGLGLLQRLRAAGHLCDVIAVTSARDADVVRPRGRPGRGALPAQAVHVRRRSAPSSSSTPPTGPSSRPTRRQGRPGRRRPDASARCGRPVPAGAAQGDERGDPARGHHRAARDAAPRSRRDRGRPPLVGASRVHRAAATSSTSPTPARSSGSRATAVSGRPRGGVPLGYSALSSQRCELSGTQAELEARVERELVEHLGRGVRTLSATPSAEDVRRLGRRAAWWCPAGCSAGRARSARRSGPSRRRRGRGWSAPGCRSGCRRCTRRRSGRAGSSCGW